MKIDCSHPRARHQHGTRNAYALDRCRCADCTAANTEYERQRSRNKLYGRPDNLIDAEPVRKHIRRLGALGMGWRRVAAAAGIANGTMYAILHGKNSTDPAECRPPRQRIRRDIADRILTVQLDIAPGTPVPSTGTVRRLQALVAAGWSLTALAPRLGMLPSNLHTLVKDRARVLRSTADQVAALYDELWNQRPQDGRTSSRAMRYAAVHGWLPPLAWDDETIDDPDAGPAATADAGPELELDEIAIVRRMAGDRVRVTHPEAAEVVRRLLAAGVPGMEIMRRTGINPWRHQDLTEAS